MVIGSEWSQYIWPTDCIYVAYCTPHASLGDGDGDGDGFGDARIAVTCYCIRGCNQLLNNGV